MGRQGEGYEGRENTAKEGKKTRKGEDIEVGEGRMGNQRGGGLEEEGKQEGV